MPTPLNQYREPDLSFIRATMAALPHLRSGQVLSLRALISGTTEEELRPLIEQRGFKVGSAISGVFAGERILAMSTSIQPHPEGMGARPPVVSGLLMSIIPSMVVSSTRAEMTSAGILRQEHG